MTVLGIDLGTTYSVMATIKDAKPKLIPNAEGNYLTPSMVYIDHNQNIFVGENAKLASKTDPGNCIQAVKRSMGAYDTFLVHGITYTPEVLSSYILMKLKKDAESYLGEGICEAVITVPAYFNHAGRQATKKAAQLAGLTVLRMINEPTAAILAYGIDKKEGECVMVLDLGGGTFDVSLLQFQEGVYQVLATAGDVALGGNDWTASLSTFLVKTYEKQFPNVKINERTTHFIEQLAEQIKLSLSTKESVKIQYPSVQHNGKGGKNGKWHSYTFDYTKNEFECLTEPLCNNLIKTVDKVIHDESLSSNKIDKLILVGGATRMPMISQAITKHYGIKPFNNIDPDKVIALGAAIQAGIVKGLIKDVVLVDVIPLSLGIRTQDGIFGKVIDRNSPIPIEKDRIFTTAEDGQSEVELQIYQGESELVKRNHKIGNFVLSDISALPKGAVKINVTFSVDVNGLLTISAVDLTSEQSADLTINAEKINQKTAEEQLELAQRYKAVDAKESKLIKHRLKLKNIIDQTKQTLGSLKKSRYDSKRYDKLSDVLNKAEASLATNDLQSLEKNEQDIMNQISYFSVYSNP